MNNSLHYLLMADHSMFQKYIVGKIRESGLTPGQPKILDYLSDHDGMMQKEIAAACHIEAASLTPILNSMEIHGLIRRENKNGNRRSLYVSLTDKGRQMARSLKLEFDETEKIAMAGLSEKEREQLLQYLGKIYDNLVDIQGSFAAMPNR